MEPRKRRRLSAESWQAPLARQAASGLTVAAFCEREGLRPASFYRWRAKLSDSVPSTHGTAETGFIDLGTLGADASRLELRLDLGGGVLLQLTRR